jgi:hypothetical protein
MFHRYDTRLQLAKKVNAHVDMQIIRESMERVVKSHSYMDKMREIIILFQYLITHQGIFECNDFHAVIWEKLNIFEEFIIIKLRTIRNVPRKEYHTMKPRLDRMHCLLEVIWELRDLIRK